MEDIQIFRKEIDAVDTRIAELFKERMRVVKKIAAWKKEHGLPVFDAKREKEILEKAAARFDDRELAAYYLVFLEDLMRVSKRYQTRLTSGMQIAYAGVQGAFADVASKRIFPSGEHVGYGDFEEAYRAVERGECDCAVLPVENSYAGTVGSVMDLIFEGDLYVTGMYDLPVSQNLLGVPGAALSDVKTVVSHPQALAQCAPFIKRMGFETRTAENTAVAAKAVAQAGDISVAAIAGRETASLYGLTVLDHDINESALNSTRFAVLSKAATKSGGDDRFILMFTVNDVAGALAGAVNVIASHGFNMKSLKSRPVKNKAWQYYFYVEAEGDETSGEGREMLKELSEKCGKLKIAGHFGAAIELKDGEKV